MSFSTEVYSHNLLHAWQVRNLESPWRFNQVTDTTINYPAHKPVYLQHHREVIAHALATAFDTFTFYIGFFPQPTYTVDEVIHLDMRDDWWDQKLSISKRYLIEFGTRTVSGDEYTVVSPHDADYEGASPQADHWNLGVIVNFLTEDISQIQVFFGPRSLEGFTITEESDAQYAIPIERRAIAAANRLTISLHKADLVYPSLWLRPYDAHGNYNALDEAADPSIFVSSLEVRRVYTNPTNAVRLLTMPEDNSVRQVETPVKPYYIDKHKGWFGLHRDSANLPIGARPFAVKVSHLSGYPLNSNYNMNPHLEEGIIRLANTNLATADIPLSSKSQLVWNKDTQGLYEGQKNFQVPPEYVNPLGLLYGHVSAWATIREFADEIVGRLKTW